MTGTKVITQALVERSQITMVTMVVINRVTDLEKELIDGEEAVVLTIRALLAVTLQPLPQIPTPVSIITTTLELPLVPVARIPNRPTMAADTGSSKWYFQSFSVSPSLFSLPVLSMPSFPRSSSARVRQRYALARRATGVNESCHFNSQHLYYSSDILVSRVNVELASSAQLRILAHLYRVCKRFVCFSRDANRTSSNSNLGSGSDSRTNCSRVYSMCQFPYRYDSV